MATNFQTPTNLTGHTIDSGSSITTRTGTSSPLSHANIDANWNRLTTKVNGIHAGLDAIHTAVNALENSSLFSSGLPTATATVKGGVRIGNGLTMNGEVLSTDTTVLNNTIDARIESEVQGNDSIPINSLSTQWTFLSSPHQIQFSTADYGVNSSGKLSGTSTTYRPINWRFIPVLGLYGIPNTARQILCQAYGGQTSLYHLDPYFPKCSSEVMWGGDDYGSMATLIFSIGSFPFPYAYNFTGNGESHFAGLSADPLPVQGTTVKSISPTNAANYGAGVSGMSPADCFAVCPIDRNNDGASELHWIKIYAYR